MNANEYYYYTLLNTILYNEIELNCLIDENNKNQK
jgi:hypothetical protein